MFATRIASLAINTLVMLVVARELGKEDWGRYGALLLGSAFVLPLSTFGFGAAILYAVSSGQYPLPRIAFTCLLVGAAQGAFDAAALVALWRAELLGEVAQSVSPPLIMATLAILPLQGAFLMGTRLLLADSRFAWDNYLNLANRLGAAGLTLVLVVLLGHGLAGAVWALVAVNLLITAALIGLLWLYYRFPCRLDLSFLRSGFSYGRRAWIGDVATRLNLRLDQAILNYTVDAGALGLYRWAVTISEILWNVPDSIAFVLFNKIASEKTQEGRARITELVHRGLLLLMIVLAIATGWVAPWLVLWILGPDYQGIAAPLGWLLPGTVVLTTTKVLTKFFGASGMPGRSSVVNAVGTALSIGFYYALIPPLGISGAAIASSAGYLFTAIAAVYFYRASIAPRASQLFAFRRGDLSWLGSQVASALPARFRRKPVAAKTAPPRSPSKADDGA